MGLFDVFKNQKKETKEIEFTSQIVKTDNISNSLEEISKKYNLALSNLDFDIFSVETYIKFHKDSDFVPMDDETEDLIIKNNLLYEFDWINNLLESLVLELLNSNKEWDR